MAEIINFEEWCRKKIKKIDEKALLKKLERLDMMNADNWWKMLSNALFRPSLPAP